MKVLGRHTIDFGTDIDPDGWNRPVVSRERN